MQAFSEELFQQSAAAGPNGHADSHFVTPRKRSTSNRFPTLAQAMSRTNATTAIMISSVGSSVPALLNGVCHNAHSLMLRPRFVAG